MRAKPRKSMLQMTPNSLSLTIRTMLPLSTAKRKALSAVRALSITA